MTQTRERRSAQLDEEFAHADIKKGKTDLMILRYMARRIHLLLPHIDQPETSWQPLVYTLQERRGRLHRVAIYNYQELLLKHSLTFVGFISRKQQHIRPAIVDDVTEVDKKLVRELVNKPGILSYSSLELRNGDWCNLVLLKSEDAKTQIRNSRTHTYAAYSLAYRYYEWIRLHNGIMFEGLDPVEMMLRRTRYYTFHVPQQQPSMRELIYG